MAVNSKSIIKSKYAENVQTKQFEATEVTLIDKFTATNVSGVDVTFSANIVPSGGTAGASNQNLRPRTITPGETYRCHELVGHTLEIGEFISTLASAATSIVIRVSAREITPV